MLFKTKDRPKFFAETKFNFGRDSVWLVIKQAGDDETDGEGSLQMTAAEARALAGFLETFAAMADGKYAFPKAK